METERRGLSCRLVVKKCWSAKRSDFWDSVIGEAGGLVTGNPTRAWAMAGTALENEGEEL